MVSKVGKQSIQIPSVVSLSTAGRLSTIAGPKGTVVVRLPKGVTMARENDVLSVIQPKDPVNGAALHGLSRTLLANAVIGVTDGWNKTLELVGTGYRAGLADRTLTLSLGFSHPVVITAPEGINFTVDGNKITVAGADKGLVGQTAAKIRHYRPPEPYKGKGIRYADEIIRRKAGKAAKASAAGAK